MSWKDLIFESEPEAAKAATTTTHVLKGSFANYPPATVTVIQTGSALYQRLKEKTVFENTAIGQILNKYLLPLLSLPIDEKAKYRAAMAQAQAQENITVGGVLGAFDALKSTLAEEQKTFDANIAETQNSGVTEKLKQQEDLKKQVTALTVQITRLDGDISIAQSKIARAQQDFQAAISTRASELDEQKTRFTGLLQ